MSSGEKKKKKIAVFKDILMITALIFDHRVALIGNVFRDFLFVCFISHFIASDVGKQLFDIKIYLFKVFSK